MPALSPLAIAKLAGALLLALALVLLVQDRNRWKTKATGYDAELTNVLVATRIAADNPKLGRAGVVPQIQLLGSALQSTTAALNGQTAAVKRLGDETARARRDADQAFQHGVKRAGAAVAAQQRLEASAASPDRLKAPCEFSDTLKEQWR